MWLFVRCTTRRVIFWPLMRARVLRARRSLDSLVFIAFPDSSLSAVALLLLGFLQDYLLPQIAHALALVRLRRTIGTHHCRNLPDQLLVDALDDDLRLRRRLDLDPF